MCGIAFAVTTDSIPSGVIASVKDSLRLRGPDGDGSLEIETKTSYINLVHTRLSIFGDESNGAQPLSSADCHLVFNGEIYNFKDLAHRFLDSDDVTSDSQVLFDLLSKFGIEILSQINGIYSFAFVNLREQTVYIGRDPFGVKPLYRYSDGKEFYFASTVKSLSRLVGKKFQLDRSDLAMYLLTGCQPEPRTGFREVAKIDPGSVTRISLLQGVDEQSFKVDQLQISATCPLDEVLARQINLESQGDVPGAVLFSSGVDSSLIAHYSSLPSIFLRYKDAAESDGRGDDNDFMYETAAALGIDVTVVEFPHIKDSNHLLSQVRNVAEGCEELIFDYTYAATFDICQSARDREFKYVLSGMGADELFMGYPRHRVFDFINKIPWLIRLIAAGMISLVFSRVAKRSKKLSRLKSCLVSRDKLFSYLHLLGFFSLSEIKYLIGVSREKVWLNTLRKNFGAMPSKKDSNKMWLRDVDRRIYLSRNLIVSDKASMNASVEMRVPFVSNAVWNFSTSSIESAEKSFFGKADLKNLLKKMLPNRLIFRKKVGFNPPMDAMLLDVGKKSILSFFADGKIYNYLQRSEVEAIVKAHFSGDKNNTYQIMQLLHFNAWLQLDFVEG